MADQLATDIATSVFEGEISFSHWSTYVGATVGGAVAAAIPGAEVGAIGSSIEIGNGKVAAKGADGLGLSISVCW